MGDGLWLVPFSFGERMIKFDTGEALMVAIEGPDRLGKETQSKKLEKALQGNGTQPFWTALRVEVPYQDGTSREPGGLHHEIYDMLKDGSARKFPVAFQTLHVANRLHFQYNVLPTWEHRDVFIFDRWNLSTRVYGACDGVSQEVTDRILQNVMDPDICFVFDGEPFHKEGLDSYEKDDEFQRRVRGLYRELSDQDPTCVRIDANRDPEVIHKEIWDRLRPLLPTPRTP